MKKRWTLRTTDESKAKTLHEELNISEILCGILVQRGMEHFEDARNFFRPQLDQLHVPWLMKDMEKAVERTIQAFTRLEKILVFGDYDVDGTTSVACMYRFLCSVYDKNNIDFYIPHRYREGYGISGAGIDFAKENGYTLIIALDCGIKSIDLVAYARSLDIDFIICDHHLPDETVPEAVAILNPKQKDCSYPFKELCGCGVGFKLISAMCEKLNLDPGVAYEYLDLVTIAIAADIVPIVGENRILAFHGLKKVNTNPNKGIAALIELSNAVTELTVNNLVFMIAPRINAAGRMDDAKKAVLLFVQDTIEDARVYAKMLHSDNTDRKEADLSVTEEALLMIEGDAAMIARKSTVLYQPHWHKGVVGIVASRLIDKYYRPTVILTQSGDYVAGSARSISGFNLYEAIHACREYLIGYGGHFFAAGMTLKAENVTAFSEKFEMVVNESITEELLHPEIVIDKVIDFKSCTKSLYNILKQMEPFGPENLRPVFMSTKVYNTGYSKIVKESHIKFSLKQNETILLGIGFGMADKFPLLLEEEPIDIVFTLDENVWNNVTTIQIKVIDFKLSWG